MTLGRLKRDDHSVAGDITREGLEAGEDGAAEVDDDPSRAAGEALAGAEVERHALPAPVVDVDSHRDEGLRAGVCCDAILLAVAGHPFPAQLTG